MGAPHDGCARYRSIIMSFMRIAAAAAVAAAVGAASGAVLAHSLTVGSLTITDLWTAAPPPGAPTAAGYLTISNSGGEPDQLVGAASPMAEQAELHKMEVKDGIMTMTPVEAIEIPATGNVTLAPGGLHVMFTTLKGPLKEGDSMPVTLTFAKAGSIDTFLHVMAVGAASMGPAAMGAMPAMDHGAAPPGGYDGQ
jgi:copper(I)-binding protein